MEDELSGNVTWDKDSRWSGTISLADGKTATFEIDGFEPIETLTEASLNTLKFLIANEPQLRHKVSVAMREHYNDTWLYENPITPDELAQRINLHSARILDEGDGDLIYTAGVDLFAGHWIQVPIDANGEIGEPELEG